MCGIWGVIGAPCAGYREYALKVSPRGPEDFRFIETDEYSFGFARIKINCQADDGMQPFDHDGMSWVCNGEIYNYEQLLQDLAPEFEATADTSCIGPVWRALAPADQTQFFRSFDGGHACALVDKKLGIGMLTRDAYGVRPLFWGTRDGKLFFASELKGLAGICDNIDQWTPGTAAVFSLDAPTELTVIRWHQVPWIKAPLMPDELALKLVRESLIGAVHKRLMSERPIAALLSGGLDSSLVASILQKEMQRATDLATGVPRKLKTFSIGLPGSEDLKYARIVAEHIGSDHYEVIVSPQDFFDAIPEVVRTIESYDITTVRASVGNFLVAREVARRTDCKVLFNGDGSDEVFGGYLYFMRAPSDAAFEAETARLLENIYRYDGLRSDRSVCAHGIEARTPFLDRQFVAVCRSVSTALRRPKLDAGIPEKWLLRQAFADTGYLPDAVLWRKKEAFSDGVSTDTKPWFQMINDFIDERGLVPSDWRHIVSTSAMKRHLPPRTKESFLYRKIFEEHYGASSATVIPHFWMPRWCGETSDPSAKTLAHYDSVPSTPTTPMTPATPARP